MAVDDNAQYCAAVALTAGSEQVRWGRLNTFLVASSILFLAWIALFVAPQSLDPARERIMFGVCIFGILTGISWAGLGYRTSKHREFYEGCAKDLEPSGGVVSRGKVLVGNPFPLWASRYIVVALPLVFCAAYLILLLLCWPW